MGIDETEKDVLSEIDRDDVVDLCQELIKIPRHRNCEGQEKRIAEFIAGELEEIGAEVSLQRVVDDRFNLIAKIAGEGDGYSLTLTGHMDTVLPGRMEIDPFAGAIRDSRIYGRGASDMKGALAAMMCALRAVSESAVRLKGDLIFPGAIGEETTSLEITYNAYALTSSEGLIDIYRKMLPAAFELLAPSPISQANEVKVWGIRGTKVGVSICWEALFPEIPRELAKRVAELIVFPTGGMLHDLKPSWRNVWLARAVENVSYIAGSVSIYGKEEGMSLIASPEGILTESSTEGVITAELDFERIRWLRSQDEELTMPKKYKTVPGLIRWAQRIPQVQPADSIDP